MSVAIEPQTAIDTAQLLARACEGDDAAFCEVAAAHEARLYRQAVAWCGDHHLAEDLVAETMVEAWRSVRRFDGSCRFSTWLCAILLHRHRKYLRRSQARPVSASSLPAHRAEEGGEHLAKLAGPEPEPAENLMREEASAGLRAAIEKLPETHQAVVLLRFYEDAALEEIAAALGVPVGTVKSRLHHALARLRSMDEVVNLCLTEGDK